MATLNDWENILYKHRSPFKYCLFEKIYIDKRMVLFLSIINKKFITIKRAWGNKIIIIESLFMIMNSIYVVD